LKIKGCQEKNTGMSKLALKKPSRFRLLPLFLSGVWTLPWPPVFPGTGLDPSWRFALSEAVLNKWQFGRDIVFTYGPLGFLREPVCFNHLQWLFALVFTLFVHFLLMLTVTLLVVKMNAHWLSCLVLLPVLFVAVPLISLDYRLLLAAVIILYLLAKGKINRGFDYPGLLFCSLLLATASLIKFNAAPVSVSILLLISLEDRQGKDVRIALCGLLSYVVFVLVLWIALGQSLFNLPANLFNSYQILSGYSGAMAKYGRDYQVYAGLACIFLEFSLLLVSLRLEDRKLFNFILLNSGLFFVAFKHGFVRHAGGNAYAFFAVCSFLFSVYFLIFYGCKGRNKLAGGLPGLSLAASIVALLFIVWHGNQRLLEANIAGKFSAVKSSALLVFNGPYRVRAVEDARADIRERYSLDEWTVRYVSDKTIDIFPWDLSLAYGYDFNWSPRPVIQSYSAYTEHLDRLNAEHFRKASAPQIILYACKSIDGRYPLFDEPETFAAVLNNYAFVHRSGEFILLSRKEKAAREQVIPLGGVEAGIGEPVKVPEYDSGHMFAQVDLGYSFWGNLMRLFYKPAFAHVRFKLSGAAYSNSFRFIPGVSKNGIFVSQYVGGIENLVSIFSGRIKNDIEEIIIDVDDRKCYRKAIKVKFFGSHLQLSGIS